MRRKDNQKYIVWQRKGGEVEKWWHNESWEWWRGHGRLGWGGGGEKGGRAAKTEKREAKREEQRGWEDRLSWTGCGRLYNEIFYWVRLGLCWQQATCILVQFKFEPLLVKFRSPRTTKDTRAARIGISTTILEASGKQIWILFPWLHKKKKKKNSFCFQCCPSTSVWQQNK